MRRLKNCLFHFSALLIVNASIGDVVLLESGAEIRGKLSGWNAGYVSINIGRTGESVERRVKQEEIRELSFDDHENRAKATSFLNNEEFEDVLPILEDLAAKRAVYLSLLHEAQEEWLVKYLETCLAMNRNEEVIQRAKLWETGITSDKIRNSVIKIKIQSALKLERFDEAAVYGKNWIDEGVSSREGMIAWIALAHQAVNNNRFRDALWLSLQPIVFSDIFARDEIAECYAIALKSAMALDQAPYSKSLYEEMVIRRFDTTNKGIEFTEGFDEEKNSKDLNLVKLFSTEPLEENTSLNIESLKRMTGKP